MSTDNNLAAAAIRVVMEMQCPGCKNCQYIEINYQQIGVRISSARITACAHCRRALFVLPYLQSKANVIRMELKVDFVPIEIDIEQLTDAVKAMPGAEEKLTEQDNETQNYHGGFFQKQAI